MKIYNVIDKDIEYKNSIFLAGPIVRGKENDWHENAYKIFEKMLENPIYKRFNFDVNLITPKRQIILDDKKLVNQIENEKDAMNKSQLIMFWIPREMNKMIGMSTQFELGYWYSKNYKKLIVGIPKNAEKVRYIKEFMKNDIQFYNTLDETIQMVLDKMFYIYLAYHFKEFNL